MSDAVSTNSDGPMGKNHFSDGPSQRGPPATQGVVMQDALQYLERVQQEFSDRPDVYLTFLSIMKEFKAGKMETPAVVQQVSHLFQGHETLLRGFQNFLSGSSALIEPAGDSRKDAAPPSAADIKMQDAMAYMDKVKEKFAHQQEVYVEFLDIIKGFQEQRIDTPGVIAGVGRLFAGDDDLLQGFNAFLPDGHRMPPPRGAAGGGSGNNSDAQRPSAPQSSGGAGASSSSASGPPAAPPPSAQQPGGGGGGGGAGAGGSGAAPPSGGADADGGLKSLHMTDAMRYMDRVRDTFHDQPEVYGEFLDIMKSFQSLKIDMAGVMNKVCVLFKGHEELLQGFNCFLPEGHRMPTGPSLAASTADSLPPPGPAGPPMTAPPGAAAAAGGGGGAGPGGVKPSLQISDAMKFMDRVRDVFIDQPEVYMQFLDIMKEFQSERLDTPGVIQQVSHLFHGHDDLIYGFNAFLPEDHRMPPPSSMARGPLRDGPGGGGSLLGGPPGSLLGGPPPSHHSMLPGGGVLGGPPGAGIMNPGALGGASLGMGPNPGGAAAGGGGGGEVNYAVNFVSKVKQRFARDPERYKLFLEVLHQYEENQPGAEYLTGTVAKLFADCPDLLKEFTFFLPPQVQAALQQQGALGGPGLPDSRGGGGARIPAGPPGGAVGEPDMSLAVNFLNKVKARFVNERDKYQLFLELLHEYERGNIPPEEVLAAVNKLLVHHPDLCREFTYFLPETRGPAMAMGGPGGAGPPAPGMPGGGLGGADPLLGGLTTGGSLGHGGLGAGGGGGLGSLEANLMSMGGGGGVLGGGQTDVNFAMHFVNKVKARFGGEPEKYTLFLNALLEYEKNPNWPNTIIDVANQLFGNQPDLLRDFSYFLPRHGGAAGMGQLMDGPGSLGPGAGPGGAPKPTTAAEAGGRPSPRLKAEAERALAAEAERRAARAEEAREAADNNGRREEEEEDEEEADEEEDEGSYQSGSVQEGRQERDGGVEQRGSSAEEGDEYEEDEEEEGEDKAAKSEGKTGAAAPSSSAAKDGPQASGSNTPATSRPASATPLTAATVAMEEGEEEGAREEGELVDVEGEEQKDDDDHHKSTTSPAPDHDAEGSGSSSSSNDHGHKQPEASTSRPPSALAIPSREESGRAGAGTDAEDDATMEEGEVVDEDEEEEGELREDDNGDEEGAGGNARDEKEQEGSGGEGKRLERPESPVEQPTAKRLKEDLGEHAQVRSEEEEEKQLGTGTAANGLGYHR